MPVSRLALSLAFAVFAAAVGASTPSPASAAMTLSQVNGGSNYYAKFSHGLPTRKSYFPTAVWLESVTSQGDIDKDKDAGINTYVAITANSDLGLVQSNGMKVLPQVDEFVASQANQATKGWFLADEVDMTHGPSAGYAEMDRVVASTPNEGRMHYVGYGKGVLFWETDAEAARFVNDYGDVVQADAYFFTDNDVCVESQAGGVPKVVKTNSCHIAANYGWIIDRLQGLISPAGSKPVWAVVELGHPFSEADWPTIAPAQVRAAVWQSLIAGARGILYFNHSFGGPDPSQHILRDGSDADSAYAPIRSVVTATNRRIKELAPVLNSPTVSSGWSAGPGTTAMVKWVKGEKCKPKKKNRKKKGNCRKAKGQLYVFAGSAGSSVTGRFSLPCVGKAKASVVGENRTIPVRTGAFSDRFADGNAIHIYRINGGSRCEPRKGKGNGKGKGKVSNVGMPGGGDPPASSSPDFRVIIAAVVLALAGMLAFFRVWPRRKRELPRSEKRTKRTHRPTIG